MRAISATTSLVFAMLCSIAAAAAAETVRIDQDRAAQMAIDASPMTDAAEARLQGSMSAVEAADAARMPVVSAGATVGRQNPIPELSVPINGPDQPWVTLFPSIETTYLADIRVLQPVYTGGATTAGREAARHDSEAMASARRLTSLDLGHAARVSYWRAVAASAGVEAATAQQRRTEHLLEDAQALRAAGMAVDADVLAARARSEAARLAVIRAETAAASALAGLRSLTGVSASATLALKDAETTALPPPPGALVSLVEDALGTRPELQSAAASAASLEARQRQVEAALRPSVSLAGQWQLARPNTRFLPLEDRWNDSWSVAVVAGWTFFDGDRTRAEAASVRARRRSVLAEREEMERRVSLEVETARLDMVAALEAMDPAEASLAAAKAREQASRERYEAGLAAVSEMLDAQADLEAAEVAVIEARAAAWIAAATLDRAVGR